VKKLVGNHAEDVGGFVIEPGATFDEKDADKDTVERLQARGVVIDAPKSKKSSTTEEG
jgi:hypothetical protein